MDHSNAKAVSLSSLTSTKTQGLCLFLYLSRHHAASVFVCVCVCVCCCLNERNSVVCCLQDVRGTVHISSNMVHAYLSAISITCSPNIAQE